MVTRTELRKGRKNFNEWIKTAEDNKPESQHIAQEIKLLQFPHGNQTLLQNNQGMHKDAVTLNPEQIRERNAADSQGGPDGH